MLASNIIVGDLEDLQETTGQSFSNYQTNAIEKASSLMVRYKSNIKDAVENDNQRQNSTYNTMSFSQPYTANISHGKSGLIFI